MSPEDFVIERAGIWPFRPYSCTLWCSLEYIGGVYFPYPSKGIRADSSTFRFAQSQWVDLNRAATYVGKINLGSWRLAGTIEIGYSAAAAVNSVCRSSILQRTATYLLTVCLTPRGKRRDESKKRGWVFTPEFADLGPRTAIDQALTRKLSYIGRVDCRPASQKKIKKELALCYCVMVHYITRSHSNVIARTGTRENPALKVKKLKENEK